MLAEKLIATTSNYFPVKINIYTRCNGVYIFYVAFSQHTGTPEWPRFVFVFLIVIFTLYWYVNSSKQNVLLEDKIDHLVFDFLPQL